MGKIQKDHLVYTFSKNAGEQVRASICTYNGRQIVNLRVFFLADDGGWRPGRKGLALSVDKLGDLESAVRALREALEGEQGIYRPKDMPESWN